MSEQEMWAGHVSSSARFHSLWPCFEQNLRRCHWVPTVTRTRITKGFPQASASSPSKWRFPGDSAAFSGILAEPGGRGAAAGLRWQQCAGIYPPLEEPERSIASRSKADGSRCGSSASAGAHSAATPNGCISRCRAWMLASPAFPICRNSVCLSKVGTNPPSVQWNWKLQTSAQV